MYKYLFITYGASGWRGVQIRALRMAKYAPKEEVIFWNLYDSDFIKDWGFAVETKDFGITDPKKIIFPEGVEVVIFADLPTNEFFNYAVFKAALNQNLKIVICEQLYRRGQLQEFIYQRFIEQSDLFLVNALSLFKTEEEGVVKIIPPQIEINLTAEVKKEIFQKYNLPENALLIFGVGYHETILSKIKELTQKLAAQEKNFYTIVTGRKDIQKINREGQLIEIPFNIGDDFFKLLYSADLVLVKFGFLQILEALALGKPTIVLGSGGFILRTPDKIDQAYKDVLIFDLEISQNTYSFVEKFVRDQNERNRLIEKIKKMHNGQLFGGRIGMEEVVKLTGKKALPKKTYPKKLAILINEEITGKESWLKNNPDVYPLGFIVGMPTENSSNKRIQEVLLQKTIREFNLDQHEEIMPHSFKDLYLFSERRLDGFTNIFSWYEHWLENIKNLIGETQEIYISDQGKEVFKTLLKDVLPKVKTYPV